MPALATWLTNKLQPRRARRLSESAWDASVGEYVASYIRSADRSRRWSRIRIAFWFLLYYAVGAAAGIAALQVQEGASSILGGTVILLSIAAVAIMGSITFIILLVTGRPYPLVLRIIHVLREIYIGMDERPQGWNPVDAAGRVSWRVREVSELFWLFPKFYSATTTSALSTSYRAAGAVLEVQEMIILQPFGQWEARLKAWCVETSVLLTEGRWADIATRGSASVQPPVLTKSRRRLIMAAGFSLALIAIGMLFIPVALFSDPAPVQFAWGLIPATFVMFLAQLLLKRAGVEVQGLRDSQALMVGFGGRSSSG